VEGEDGNPFMEELSGLPKSEIKRGRPSNPPKVGGPTLPPPEHKLHLRTHREIKTEMSRIYTHMAHNRILTGQGYTMISALRSIAGTMAEAVAVRRAEQVMEIERLEARIMQLRQIVEDAECRVLGSSQRVLSSTPVSTASSED
jgi:hypothetical protein